MSRSHAIRSERRARVVRQAEAVRVALELVAEFGPEGVTTVAIADRMGVAQTTLFKHFPNKDAIWAAVTDAIGAHVSGRMRRIVDPSRPPLENVELALVGYTQLARELPAIAVLLCHRGLGDGASHLRDLVAQRFNRMRSNVRTQLRAAADARDLRANADPEVLTNLLVAIVQAAMMPTSDGGLPDPKAVEAQVRFVLSLVRRAPSGES